MKIMEINFFFLFSCKYLQYSLDFASWLTKSKMLLSGTLLKNVLTSSLQDENLAPTHLPNLIFVFNSPAIAELTCGYLMSHFFIFSARAMPSAYNALYHLPYFHWLTPYCPSGL